VADILGSFVETFAWQTSWGVSWRLIGALIMVHGDDKGLVLPPRVAPIQVVIVPIYYSDSDKEIVLKKTQEIEQTLKNKIRVRIDARDEWTPGYKFHDWEMKGVPLRIEVGPKDIAKGKMVLVRRDTQKKSDLEFSNTEIGVESILKEIQQNLFERAKLLLKERTKQVSDFDKFKSEIENGMFLETSWCGDQNCEEKMKESTGADIRVIPFDNTKTDAPCVSCKRPGKENVIFARGY